MQSSDLKAFVVEVGHLVLWLSILVVIFVPLEQVFTVRRQKIWRKGIVTDLIYYFVNSLIPAGLLAIPISLLGWSIHQILPTAFLQTMAGLPLWAKGAIALVVGEFGYYWGHRLSHQIPWLWRFHSIHHSAEHIDFLVNIRAHPIDMIYGRLCELIPVYIIGLGDPLTTMGNTVAIITIVFGTMWGFFVHANLRWRYGPLEWLIATPAFHHWHHTLDGPMSCNYSSRLPFLDWLFGTFHLPGQWPQAYGIRATIPENFADQLTYPLFKPMEEPEAQTPQTGVEKPQRSESERS
jgi:sterol desaturase/sphingolipid hydroxylase (fatty acid hydroxylase superfamily)